jgi:hypothetical protein
MGLRLLLQCCCYRWPGSLWHGGRSEEGQDSFLARETLDRTDIIVISKQIHSILCPFEVPIMLSLISARLDDAASGGEPDECGRLSGPLSMK